MDDHQATTTAEISIEINPSTDVQSSSNISDTNNNTPQKSGFNSHTRQQLSVNFDTLDATEYDVMTNPSLEALPIDLSAVSPEHSHQQHEQQQQQYTSNKKGVMRPSMSMQSISTPVNRSDKFIEDSFAPLKRLRSYDHSSRDTLSPLGLTTTEAKERFTSDLRDTINEADRQSGKLITNLLETIYFYFISKPLSGGLTILLLIVNLLCLICACILKWTSIPHKSNDRLEEIRITVECVLLFSAIIVVCMLNMERYTRKKKVYIRLLKKRFEKMIHDGFEFSIKRKNGNIFEGINMIPYRLVFVYRDDKWTKLPHVLLVAGDYVYSHSPKKDLENNDIKYRVTSKEGFYVLNETPIRTLLSRNFSTLQSRDSKVPLTPKLDFYSSIFAVMGTISFFVVLIVNIIRVAVPVGDNDWVSLLLMHPSYICLLTLPIGFPLSWLIFNVVVKARLASVFTVVTDVKRQKEFSTLDPKTKHLSIRTPITSFIRNFFQILIHKSLAYDSVLALGSVTALCFVNKNGVLADLLYAPEKLLLIKTGEDEEQQQHDEEQHEEEGDIYQTNNEYADDPGEDEEQYYHHNNNNNDIMHGDDEINIELVEENGVAENDNDDIIYLEENHDEYNNNEQDHNDIELEEHGFVEEDEEELENTELIDRTMDNDGGEHVMSPVQSEAPPMNEEDDVLLTPNYVVLDLMFDRETADEQHVLNFEDPDWRRHINLLKPLGLNSLITGTSKLPDFDSVEGMVDAKSHLWKKYVYLLGKEIGFSDDVLESFSFRKRIHTQRSNKEMSAVIVEYEGAGMQIHSFGHPQLLVDYCSDYWDGNDIRPISDQIREHISETYSQWSKRRDLYCLALAYKPIDARYNPLITESTQGEDSINIRDQDIQQEDLENLEEPNSAVKTDSLLFDTIREKTTAQKFNAMQCGQIFLGMIAFRQQPKTNLPDFIRDLENDSGVRFIFFSSHNTQRTKAFGAKLGMETDWNSCISLTERDVNLDESDIRAKLPHGIKDIREHIKYVDNVPLLVNLFSDATPDSTAQMVSILQENHEVVCCVGSSIAIKNLPVYSQTNVCIAVDPASEQHMADSNNKVNDLQSIEQEENDFQEDFSGLFSFPVAFHIRSNPQNEQLIATFPILFHLIKEGRRSIANLKQALTFLMCSNLCLFTIQILSQLLFLPSTLFTGVQCLWMMFVIIPLLSLALVCNPIEPKIMDLISSKNVLYKMKAVKWLFMNYMRFFLPIPISIVVYVWTLFSMRPQIAVGWKTVFGTEASNSSIYTDPAFLASVTYAQNITLFVVVIYLCFISIGFIHRVHSIFTVKIYNHIVWMFTIPLVVLLQLIFCLVACSSVQKDLMPRKFPNYPFYAYIIVLVLPPLPVIIDELAKIRLRKKYFINQKRLKLQFGTRLGMYSPR
jgi:hypothetical protein